MAADPRRKWADARPLRRFESEFEAQIELPINLGFDVLFPSTIPLLTKVAAHHVCVLVSLRSSPTALRAQLGVLALRPFFEVIESGRGDGEAGLQGEGGADPQGGAARHPGDRHRRHRGVT